MSPVVRLGLAVATAMWSLATGVPPAYAKARPQKHDVVAGQTVWSIAYANGVKVEDLLLANGLADPAELRAGQQLTLPERTAPKPVFSTPRRSRRHSDDLQWPLRGLVTSRYGWRRGAQHTGIDIAATRGTIISAAGAGLVVRAGTPWGRYGNVVLIEHPGGLTTLYAHVSRCFVREGQTLDRGDAIASVGATGNATGPHLHFEVWQRDETRDPLKHLTD